MHNGLYTNCLYLLLIKRYQVNILSITFFLIWVVWSQIMTSSIYFVILQFIFGFYSSFCLQIYKLLQVYDNCNRSYRHLKISRLTIDLILTSPVTFEQSIRLRWNFRNRIFWDNSTLVPSYSKIEEVVVVLSIGWPHQELHVN